MHPDDSRVRMWALTLLYVLGLNIYQATGQGNSTQMHYMRLIIEFRAISHLKEILKPFVYDPELTVDNLQITTTCQNVSGVDSQFSCSCETGYKWNDEVCQSDPKCCDGNTCVFSQNSNHTCVSDSTVTISGSLILPGQNYSNCLDKKNKDNFHKCNSDVIEKMKKEYSTLQGFDSLTIIQYSIGSVKADFQMIFAQGINPEALIEKSLNLSQTLESRLTMETTGFINFTMPPNPVHYNSQNELTCTVPHNLNTQPAWSLSRGNENFKITTGTEAKVNIELRKTNIKLLNVTELWAGEYTCSYTQDKDNIIIHHKASGVMDVCLKPNIHIFTRPSFPHCRSKSDAPIVKVICETGSSNESYSVTWSGEHVQIVSDSDGETGVFQTEVLVSCNPNWPLPKIMCTLKNRCNQTTTASHDINIIYENNQFCIKDGDWEETKATFTAYLKCKDQAGTRQRKCNQGSEKGEWEEEVSDCVNKEVNNVLQKANIVNIGLGAVNDNAATVFSLLETVTNNSQTIDTFANLNTTVSVLVTLSQKLPPQQNSVVDNLLGSSSNLLDRSLNRSWSKTESNDSLSMAERYLSSVEDLIHSTNITNRHRKKNLEVEARNCSQDHNCTTKVLNNTIHLKGDNPGSVKSTGFQELVNYLPNNFEDYDPNSIVVSTTTENNISNSVQVEISFQLLQQRPHNFKMICVAWDNKTRGWSRHKCKWEWLAGSGGTCVCEHLSSFAILMGKKPLEVKGLTEITYTGLSVSVLSLVITLIIEMVTWSNTVKTNTSYLRHTAHINICLCLLVADCAFLASSQPPSSPIWCKTLVVLKHFCYLAMFFWMLWLSSTLLHQTVFLFHNVSKKNYLKLSVFMGYVCPLLIVTITFLANKAGAEGHYYSKDTCWLVYKGLMKGSVHAFIIPIGTIVFFNIVSMLVVIMKLLEHPQTATSASDKDKKSTFVVIRAVALLTPVFGVTWILGFAVMILDLNYGVIAHVANYAFVLLNSFQGFFILLTICLGDTTTREELRNRLKRKATQSAKDSITDSTTTK